MRVGRDLFYDVVLLVAPHDFNLAEKRNDNNVDFLKNNFIILMRPCSSLLLLLLLLLLLVL